MDDSAQTRCGTTKESNQPSGAIARCSSAFSRGGRLEPQQRRTSQRVLCEAATANSRRVTGDVSVSEWVSVCLESPAVLVTYTLPFWICPEAD